MSPIFRHGRNKRALVRRGCSALYHHIRRDVRRSKEVIESAMMKSKREVGLTVLGFVLLVLPVLARGTPLHFVLDDRHSSQGLGLPELHHRGAGERFHQLDVGRRRHVCTKKKSKKKSISHFKSRHDWKEQTITALHFRKKTYEWNAGMFGVASERKQVFQRLQRVDIKPDVFPSEDVALLLREETASKGRYD